MIMDCLPREYNPPLCPQALLECTDVEKLPPWGTVILFKGNPPPILASTRVYPGTPAHPFSILFLMSKNQAHKLQNGSLGDPKITKKTIK